MNERAMKDAGAALVFLGCGRVTRTHSRTLASVAPDLPLFYASRDAEKAREYCRRFRGAGWFASYEDALRDDRSTIALVATPPATHFDLTFTGLAAGRHVIVEKPAFLRASDCELVRHAAHAAGRQVMVAENYAYKPLATHLRRVIAQRTLGEPRLIHINALRTQDPTGWRADAGLAGGGALFEGGIHWIGFLADLGLAVRRVTAHRAGDQTGMDLTWLVTFEYENGAVGQLWYSWEIPSLLRGLRLSSIYGTAGTLTFETNGLFVLEAGRRRRLTLPAVDDIRGYRAMFLDFLDAMRINREPRYTLGHAQRDLALLEEMTCPRTRLQWAVDHSPLRG
jgi:predicted dehydrogenase